MAFFDALNTRETAWLIWVAVLLVGLVFIKPIRKSINELLKAFFQKTILTLIVFAAIYSICLVWILSLMKLWNSSMMKDTLIWFGSTPLLSLFKITKIAEDKRYFTSIFKDLIAFSAIADFIVGSYTFSLWAELALALVGIFSAMLLAVGGERSESISLQAVLKVILLLIGGSMIIYSLTNILLHFLDFASWQTLNSFMLTPLLTVMYLPFIYLLLAYIEYDTTSKILPRAIQNQSLLYEAKKKALLHFGLSWRAVRRWRASVFKHPPHTSEELKKSFVEIKELRRQAKNPPVIEATQGWSPYAAKNFLQAEGIVTGDYDRCFDDSFFATSPYVKLNSAVVLPDMLTYSVEGSKEKATKLNLCFTNNAPFHPIQIEQMVRYSSTLFLSATRLKMPLDIEDAIKSRTDHHCEFARLYCSVKNNDFPDGKKGYWLSVSIGV